MLADFDVDAFNRLREEKDRLREALESMVLQAGDGGVSPADRGAWAELYERWQVVRDEITRVMDQFNQRLRPERRHTERRSRERRLEDLPVPRGERRQAERRRRERRHRADRRDPLRARNPFRKRPSRADDSDAG